MLKQLTKPYQTPIFLDHDGSVDDFVSLITLLTLDKHRITGISVTAGNCFIDSAIDTTHKILRLFCRYDIEVCKSSAVGLNEFPEAWRLQNMSVNSIKTISNQNADYSKISTEDSVDFTAQKIISEDLKTTVVLTGPATNLANAIKKYPELIDKIDKVLWVAGAFLANGNVVAPDHDGSAEWNIFWNPTSAYELLSSGVQIFLFPLDVSQLMPVDSYLMYHLEKNIDKKLSELVYLMFKPNYETQNNWFMHDVLPAIFLKQPEIFRLESKSINVEQRGTSLGNLYRSSLGMRIKQVSIIDEELFYDLLIDQLQQF